MGPDHRGVAGGVSIAPWSRSATRETMTAFSQLQTKALGQGGSPKWGSTRHGDGWRE
jgi:hypothetical protein